MRTGTFRLPIAVAVLLAAAPAALHAAGLLEDPRTLFMPFDTARAVVTVSEAEINLDGASASLFSLETRLGIGARTIISLAAEFAALRRETNLAYGIGDCRVDVLFRCAGDSLGGSGVYVRAACRAPTGSPSLFPFSYRSLDGSAGCELRGRIAIFAARAAALYALAGERSSGEGVVHDNKAVLAGSLSLDLPRSCTASAAASFARLTGGAERQAICLSLAVALSDALTLTACAAAESGSDGAAAYERLAGLSLAYRFPPRAAAQSRPAVEP